MNFQIVNKDDIPFYIDQSNIYYHQTTNLESIKNIGWDVSFESGVPRLYGNGIYFSSPKKFWPDLENEMTLILAHLDLSQYIPFDDNVSFHHYTQVKWNLNPNADSEKDLIRLKFIENGVKCVSFPEDMGDETGLTRLVECEQLTYVVFDPQIIYVIDVKYT